MTKLNFDVFEKNFDALSALKPNTQFISKNFDVVGRLGRLVEQFCSLFSSDERYSSQKYNWREVAKNINQFIENYSTKKNFHVLVSTSKNNFEAQANTLQGVQKIEKIIMNLLILQDRFAHGKDERAAEDEQEVFKFSIKKLINILPAQHSLKLFCDSYKKFDLLKDINPDENKNLLKGFFASGLYKYHG